MQAEPASLHPPFSFRLAEKKTGRARLKRKDAAAGRAMYTWPSKPPAGDGWLAPCCKSETETLYRSLAEAGGASQESPLLLFPRNWPLLRQLNRLVLLWTGL